MECAPLGSDAPPLTPGRSLKPHMVAGNAKGQLRVFAQSPADDFERVFREIEACRMRGLPVLNPKLSVKAVRFRRFGNDWFGTVVTPWAIFAVYACGAREAWVDLPSGATRTIELPAGDFPFTAIDDEVLGRFLALSLKSPVLDVGDQETAELIANFAFENMLTAQAIPEDDEAATAWVPPTADGELRRVIPIRIAPPKDMEKTPALTPKAPEAPAEESPAEPFFKKRLSRRALFAGASASAKDDARVADAVQASQPYIEKADRADRTPTQGGAHD